ncbi:hypothetical protein GCM10010284_05270 [Streptomyces rubiginosohelvolus]|uniref:Uncharacterized protein n=1 Tax=Streptomyces rubiginosohelvolus TaxID=67362 RepID=A0ABQ3BE70_9ACTN|nr:hypothetical protein GCM10010284_05270 [Streptomyces rubiginosohelvolus]GGZ39313.1 hypothetical protein GCM10010328_11730 [Streptomyces pluricolorescens]
MCTALAVSSWCAACIELRGRLSEKLAPASFALLSERVSDGSGRVVAAGQERAPAWPHPLALNRA